MRSLVVVVGVLASAISHAAPPRDAGLSADEINRVMQAHQRAFRRCFERALKKQPDLIGRFVYRFTIGSVGKVVAAAPVKGTKASAAVDACIVTEIKGIVFRAPGTPVTINYPLTSSPP